MTTTDLLLQNPLLRLALKKVGVTAPLPLERDDSSFEDAPKLAIFWGGSGPVKTYFANLWPKKKNAAPNALLFDATQITTPEATIELHEFMKKHLQSVEPQSRVLLYCESLAAARDPQTYAIRFGLKGFVKSLAKELGKKAVTVNLIYGDTSEQGLSAMASLSQFLLSGSASFITGQIFSLSEPGDPSEANLKDKWIAVTGATGGIGEATVHSLANRGAKVLLVDLPSQKKALHHLAERVGGLAFECDLSEEKASEDWVTFLNKNSLILDGVIHNAGITRDKTLRKMKTEDWRQVMQVNFASVEAINNALLDNNLLAPRSRLVHTASISGIAGNFGQTNYAYSKSAIIGYTQSLACRLSQKQMAANAIAPGFIETPMTAAIPLLHREFARRLSAMAQGGLPRDVAETAAFLVSPNALGLNGSVIRVCGGHFLGA